MKINCNLVGTFGIVLCSALLGNTTYGQPSVEVGVSVSLPTVEIRAESDFYEPLTPLGEWVVIGSYGRCWRPARIESDWRPYCNGNWQRTDAGWYWVSDEPWAWATYHYGRWNFSEQDGWYWVPQVQWAPAWVSWHSGGGYIGWAPLCPSGVIVVLPRACVFVQERHFMEPVRRSTVVVNNTTIINQTTVINQGPTTAYIEKTGGRKIEAVPVQELRHKTEAAVAGRQRAPAAGVEKKMPVPVHSEAQPAEKKTVSPGGPVQVEKPATTTHESAMPAPKNNEAQSETRKSVPAAAEPKPPTKFETKPGGNNPNPPAIKEPSGQNANHQPARQEKPVQPSNKKAPPTARENSADGGNNGTHPADKDRENRGKE